MARFNRSAETSSGPQAQFREALAQAQARWQGLGERERLALGGLAAAMGLLLAWSVLIAPAMRTLKTAPAELDRLELQLQQMQVQAQEARALRAAPTVPPAQAQEALKASIEHLGPVARLNLTGDRAVVTLNGIEPAALQAWLAEVRAAARARPVEAQLARNPKGWSGSIVLSLGGA